MDKRVVSLFSGAGGLDKGFELAGFDIIWANEINASACKTYRMNLGNYIIEGDIKTEIANLPKYADIVVGGFPCQDISINGKMLGVNGKRSSLYSYIVEAVKRVKYNMSAKCESK